MSEPDFGDMSFGDIMKTLRGEKGLYQRELARRAAYSVPHISKMERNVTAPSTTAVSRLVHVFGLVGKRKGEFLAAARRSRQEHALAKRARKQGIERQQRLTGAPDTQKALTRETSVLEWGGRIDRETMPIVPGSDACVGNGDESVRIPVMSPQVEQRDHEPMTDTTQRVAPPGQTVASGESDQPAQGTSRPPLHVLSVVALAVVAVLWLGLVAVPGLLGSAHRGDLPATSPTPDTGETPVSAPTRIPTAVSVDSMPVASLPVWEPFGDGMMAEWRSQGTADWTLVDGAVTTVDDERGYLTMRIPPNVDFSLTLWLVWNQGSSIEAGVDIETGPDSGLRYQTAACSAQWYQYGPGGTGRQRDYDEHSCLPDGIVPLRINVVQGTCTATLALLDPGNYEVPGIAAPDGLIRLWKRGNVKFARFEVARLP